VTRPWRLLISWHRRKNWLEKAWRELNACVREIWRSAIAKINGVAT